MPHTLDASISNVQRISSVSPTARPRSISRITTAPQGYEGEGFPVHRAFAGVPMSVLDPFVHMDEMGEVEYAAGEPKGTPWHPHRGFETFTYLMEGTFVHQDSHGGGGVITNGGTQYMTAGSGILHIETPPEELVLSGGLFHGVQLWINLPKVKKWLPPAYQNLENEDVTVVSSTDGGTIMRILAGELNEFSGPGISHTPLTIMHASVFAGATLEIEWPKNFNALAYVFSGEGTVGDNEHKIAGGQLVVFGDGDTLKFSANPKQSAVSPTLELFILGGVPLREPVVHYGPFVMNTREEIMTAMDDYQRGRLGTIPANAIMPHQGVKTSATTSLR